MLVWSSCSLLYLFPLTQGLESSNDFYFLVGVFGNALLTFFMALPFLYLFLKMTLLSFSPFSFCLYCCFLLHSFTHFVSFCSFVSTVLALFSCFLLFFCFRSLFILSHLFDQTIKCGFICGHTILVIYCHKKQSKNDVTFCIIFFQKRVIGIFIW